MEDSSMTYDELEDIRPRRRGCDDWDESDDEEEDRDPTLDPGFSSWQDYYRYMYG